MKKNNENFVSIADLLHLCLVKWHWFAISLLLCLAVAVFRISHMANTYTCNASILVLKEKLGKSVHNIDDEEFSDMGLVNQDINVANVIIEIASLDVLMEVARRLDLDADEEKLMNQALAIRGRLRVEKADKQSSVINLTYKDYTLEKARRTLALIVEVYNEKWLQEKILTTQLTSSFIDSRLDLLQSELDSVDNNISTFKSNNKITDLSKVGDVYLQQRSHSDAEIMRMTNQRAVAKYIRSLLKDKNAPHTLLPVNSGINNDMIESQISLYNSQVMQYNSHLDYTSTQNPRIINQEKELGRLRSNILDAVDNHINALNIQIKSLEGYNNQAVYNISSNPLQAKYLASVEREQKVKEGLYLYLLQKKEENEISSSYQHSSIKVLDIPYKSGNPSSGKIKTLAVALLLGLLVPTAIVFLRAVMDKTVRGRVDLEDYPNLTMIGEVPSCDKKKQFSNKSGLIVRDGKQDSVNEAFRLLRTKLSLNSDDKVYTITSFEDKDGKTFVSTNLAFAMAINHQHVLFVDGDLRQGTASRLLGAKGRGLADYLSGKKDDFSSLIFQPNDYPTLDILPAGEIPSNPTELLASRQFGELIAAQRPNYDVILVDTPKADKFADVDLIADQSDVTLFVVKAGKTERQKIDELAAGQEKRKCKHLALVLNGI